MKLPSKDSRGKKREEEMREFADEMKKLSHRVGMKISARGWCYIMEGFNLITKAQFDEVQKLINGCRRNGMLPIDFVAQEEARQFSGVEEPDTISPSMYIRQDLEFALNAGDYYTPDWWEGEQYYIQMLVEKIDLKTLFEPVCRKFHIPIATCFDSKTEILTKTGWKKFTNLDGQDRVASMNKRGQVVYMKPMRIINEKYEGDMYHIKNRGTNQLITPNHNIYVQRQRNRKENLRFEITPIQEVAHLQNLKFKKDIKWIGNERKYFKMPSIKPQHAYNNIKKKVDMDTWLQFMGYYISEGCSNYKQKHSIYAIQLAQSFNKHPDTFEKMKKCIKKLGYKFYAGKNSIQISNKQLHLYLKPLGKCHEKFIPREFLELSPRQLRILLNSLIEGDGYNRGIRSVYITSSKKLSDDVQELALKAGFYASISLKAKTGIIKGKKIKKEHQCYCVNICKARGTFCINHGKKDYRLIKYSGRVHCVEVPGGLIYVRREGKPIWSGNSKGWQSMLQRTEYGRRYKEAEEKFLSCVLLYCGDHDPDGGRISDKLRKNLEDLMHIEWDDGTDGYDPKRLDIKRFGLDYDFITANKLTWIDNLITSRKNADGSARDLADPSHPNHFLPYVQDYLKKYGPRKCEANSLIIKPDESRMLCRQAIEEYLDDDAEARFREKRKKVRQTFDEFRERTGLNKAIRKIIDLIEKEERD